MLKAEKVGISLSILCAIHCAALPIMLTAFPLIGAEVTENHFLENVLVGGSILFAFYSLIRDYLIHKNFAAIILCVAGFAGILLSHHLPQTLQAASAWLAVAGGLMVATSYLFNFRLRKTCKIKTAKI